MAVIRGLMFLFLVLSLGDAGAKHCPFGWTPFGTECYKFFSQKANWVTAERNCQGHRGNLASVSSKIQYEFLLSLVPGDTTVWVGGHDGEMDGQWLWSDGSSSDYFNWCPNEPNNYEGFPESCIEINWTNDRCWNDETCSHQLAYICAQHN